MIERTGTHTGTHWGAIGFTAVAGSLLLAVALGPVTIGLRGWTGPVPKALPHPTAAPSGRPTATLLGVPKPAPGSLGAAFIRGSASPVIYSGTTATVALLFRNTGSVAWVKGTDAEARLGIVGEDRRAHDLGMAVEWVLPTRPAVQDETVVVPGGSAQFAFRVKGSEPGTYVLRLAPVIDGVGWMVGPEGPAVIEVTVR